MVREVITLPLRVGVSATRRGLRVTARAAGVAFRITRLVIGGSEPTEPHVAATDAPESSSAFVVDVVIASSPSRAVAPAPPGATSEPGPTAPSAPAAAPARDVGAAPARAVGAAPEIPPAHVSEGLQFVEAFAEPGAEEGAGAAVHVEEPWANYSQMTADEVIVRLADATPEELAVVALYEGVHRRRKTVLAGASRRLRSATASASAAPARRA